MRLTSNDQHWNRPVLAQLAEVIVVPNHLRNPQDGRMFAACAVLFLSDRTIRVAQYILTNQENAVQRDALVQRRFL